MNGMWPQILVGALFVALTISGFVRHGKPIDPTQVNCMQVIWITFTLAAVLGAGGFWNIR